MALNYSHRPIFPAHRPEENIVQGAGGGSHPQERDIRDILPADPFGMNMDISSTMTAITGWLEDLGADYGGYHWGGDVGVGGGRYPFFAGWNFCLDTALEFKPFVGRRKEDDCVFRADRVGGFFTGEELSLGFGRSVSDGGVHYGCCAMEGVMFGFDSSDSSVFGNVVEEKDDDHGVVVTSTAANDDDDEGHHSALGFALAYLGVRDLLNVERVCKSLRYTVQSDPLLWKSIHIDQPLNDRLTDDILIELTNRAQGSLQCLSLVDCQRITDDGLKRILESNPRLTKVSVPGCTRLSIDGVVSCLRDFQMGAINGIKYLRIGGLYGVTMKHFEELISLLSIYNKRPISNYKPHFYHRGNLYLSSDDDRPIDIEMCPRCQNLRLVYDCPAESCQSKDHATQPCRACTLCIARCSQCGKCINDGEYEETFCLELLCSDCWKHVLKCQEERDTGTSSSKHAVSLEPGSPLHGQG